MNQKTLGEFEHIVLLALLRLESNAYGAAIRQLLQAEIDRDVALGALYSTLDRMEKKSLVVSKLGEATAQRGGRPKRFFSVTAEGKTALKHAKRAMDSMWHGVVLTVGGESHEQY
ncbi:PadR family transcriptional regulator [Paraglaciecola sp. MB-3u-78]|uniref:PadR family transcriptional regulator n=1 Tax=Paraglaciecola sp. MB-3u-78 TaxID=2058332 RepID=UPI000C34749A|nr:PadR family transcriptional regulator [Paraglaciecola sp. MB-3u-78]PKG96186.1 PadR family transcriptional regulator [Paraglaciecola sp. MB-3u-78]